MCTTGIAGGIIHKAQLVTKAIATLSCLVQKWSRLQRLSCAVGAAGIVQLTSFLDFLSQGVPSKYVDAQLWKELTEGPLAKVSSEHQIATVR
jgi:hypothetical protein